MKTNYMSVRTPMTLETIPLGVGLENALAMTPAEVIATMTESGMKGRGGAGFPTGIKWDLCSKAPTDDGVRYVICNADEGEPGTFKDRVVLHELPDLVFEGMTIAGRAIGSSEGILYLRGEYLYLLDGLEETLQRRRDAGLLGDNINGSGFSFDFRIFLGAGAYVCGEETALIESIEGRRGESRNRPPYPVECGLHGKPTIVNNVETFAWTSAIFAKGADWFSSIGTDKSTGPKLLSISGDVQRPGVYEFPLGVSIAEVLDAAGGNGAKAAIIGGAAGTCVPAREFDRAISYEDVSTGGAVIVVGPWRDLLEVAENLQWFFADESCGQCTPCRVGCSALLTGIRDLRVGTCTPERLRDLVALGETMQFASKCGLGQSAPNVFLSLVDKFESEITGHIPLAVRNPAVKAGNTVGVQAGNPLTVPTSTSATVNTAH